MHRKIFLGLLMTTALAASSANASIVMLADGLLTGSSAGPNTDLSGLSGFLENGLPANVLGGLGSGIAYAGGNTFLAVPDRGPNATPYNSAVDDTVSYINRIQTVHMTLTANDPSSLLPFSLTPTLTKTTLLYSPTPLTYGSGVGLGNQIDGVTPIGSGAPAQNTSSAYYFTGRSDNFGPGTSGAASDARLDPESIRVSNDGLSVFISDEYGPYVRQFNRQTGQLIKTFALPGNLDISNLSPNGAVEISGNTSGRVANKGMEGLALTPDGKTLVGVMQAALIQDAASKPTSNMLRIVTIDIASGTTHEYGYNLTTGSGVSDIVAINNHQFILDERDGKGLGDGSSAKVKQFFKIDLTGAADITNLTGAAAAADVVSKSSFLDLVAILKANGFAATQIPAKIEGLAFGEDVTVNGQLLHTLFVANDNDFVPGTAGPNQFFVLGFQNSDLPGYLAQQVTAVPEPAAWALMLLGFGGLGAMLRARRRQVAAATA